ncbi:MAG: SCO6880 family protein [Actinomycetota bacterium]
MSDTSGRMYRFPPLDRTGWLLGLSGAQCVILAAGTLAAGLLLDARAPAPAVVAALALAVTAAFAPWDGRPAHQWLPALARVGFLRFTGRHAWVAELPFLSRRPDDAARPPSLPPFLDGLTLTDAGSLAQAAGPAASPGGVAVVHDRRHRTASASLRAGGCGFALLERAEQDRLVALWGDVLAGFCAERSAVVSVRVTEWAGPDHLSEFERFADQRRRAPTGSPAVDSYRELLADAGERAARHDVLVTVTVALHRLRRHRGKGSAQETASAVLLEELRLLTGRLEAAGVDVAGPLSLTDTAEAMRMRADPTVVRAARRRNRSLAAMAGLVSPWNWGPLATESDWDHLRVDGALHRTYWVAEWPRLDVPAGWLEPILLHAGGTRTFTVHCEPVPPSRSRRRIDRDATRLAADGEQRSRAGFRVGARHHRSEAAVLEREAELVAGHNELEYAGFLTVTAATDEELKRSCADYEQAAAQAGLELRPVHGQHDLGFVCALPVGRGLATRRTL